MVVLLKIKQSILILVSKYINHALFVTVLLQKKKERKKKEKEKEPHKNMF